MAPYREPVFSQGRAWLPPWLAAASLQPDAAICETPSMFAASWKDLDEPILNFSAFKDITNKSFPCLHLSDDRSVDALLFRGVEDFKLENTSGAHASQCEQPKALALQLSLSQSQATPDSTVKGVSSVQAEFEGERNLKSDGNTIVVNKQQERSELVQSWGTSGKGLSNDIDKVMITEKPSVAAAQSTGSAELFNPVAQQLSQLRGKSRTLPYQSAQLQIKRPAEKLPLNAREGKKLKLKNKKAVTEDVQVAIGLTVATAETLAIADILNGCQMCQSVGPKAILDAALMLRKEREAVGLDSFTLEDAPCKASTDQECDVEDLDDTTLEAEFRGTQTTGSMKEALRGNPCMVADTEITKSLIKAENASTTGVNGHPEATTSWQGYHSALGVVQRLNCTRPVLLENGDEGITMHDCSQGQLVATKDSFNSRWLGGWTGAKCDKDKQVGDNLQQPAKKQNELFRFETSELSESCDLTPPIENLLRCSENYQNRGADCAVTSMPEVHVEALTAGSYAEILLALSQASVKCSLQEPLCSFVPCSVSAKPRSSTNELAKCNGLESNNEMAVKLAGSMVNCPTSGIPCVNKNLMVEHDTVLESSPTGVKRNYSNSLQRYSTNALSPLVEALMRTSEKQHPNRLEGIKETSCVNYDLTDRIVKEHGLTVPCNKSTLSGQCELILQDSALQDSPPLIWHRGKRRRLRAWRIAESDLIHCENDNTMCGFFPNDGSAVAKFSTEPSIQSHEDCAGFEQATLALEDGAQLQSLDKHVTSVNHIDTRVGVQEECTVKTGENEHNHTRLHEDINSKYAAYNQRGMGSTSSQLFKGIDFLVTGFPASQKDFSEEVSKKIQDHGGVILLSVPSFLSLDRQKTISTTRRHSIIIAPQKVRTLKYLYGCAAGLLIVRPNWLDECIRVKRLLFKHKYKEKGSAKQCHILSCLDDARRKDLIFSQIAAFLHGQRSYCSKLSLLIQHGGGKVFRSAKSLVQANDAKGFFIQIVVAEHHSKLPQTVKETAANSGFSIVSGDWIIDSLFNGKLVSLPATKAFRDMKGSTVRKGITTKLAPQRTGLSGRKMQLRRDVSSFKTAIIDNILPSREVNMDEQCISFLGKGEAVPALSRMGLSFVLELPQSCTLRELQSGQMYYKAACINGVIYSAGDIVEVRPEDGEEKEPYVAQIESFYAPRSCNVKTRSSRTGPKRLSSKVCFLCCRWFYRPSDTGFPCVGTGKELYLSQHFDDNAPVSTIIRRVQLMLFVDGKAMTNDSEKGWRMATETSCTVEEADYVCRFYYDYRQESLHQVKSALTS